MSDEEIVRAYIDGSYYETPGGPLYHYETDGGIDAIGAREPTHAAFTRILSDRDVAVASMEFAEQKAADLWADRDSLRAALERIAAGEGVATSMDIARQALTSSEKENDPGPIGTKPLLSKVDGNAIREALDSNREGT